MVCIEHRSAVVRRDGPGHNYYFPADPACGLQYGPVCGPVCGLVSFVLWSVIWSGLWCGL